MHRISQGHPLCASEDAPKGTHQGSLGVTVLSMRLSWPGDATGGTASPFREQSEALGKQGAALFSTDKSDSLQPPKVQVSFLNFMCAHKKQITRFVFNPKSSFGIIWMHQARGLQNRRVSLRAPSPASAVVSGI